MPNQWTEELAIGVETVDAQHRALYAKVAELHEVMRSHQLDRVLPILEFLEGHVLQHFETEERLMEDLRYPGLAQHRAAHEDFVRSYLRVKALFKPGVRPSAVVELSGWLGRWLGEHIRKQDREMGKFLRAQEPQADGARGHGGSHLGPPLDATPGPGAPRSA
jgi:hemerythrin